MLTYADVCWRMLTYADVCWRMLTYADVCWRRRARKRQRGATSVCCHTVSSCCSVCVLMLLYAYCSTLVPLFFLLAVLSSNGFARRRAGASWCCTWQTLGHLHLAGAVSFAYYCIFRILLSSHTSVYSVAVLACYCIFRILRPSTPRRCRISSHTIVYSAYYCIR
jgi:hypothetical protein